ncbi:MAG TPA: sensor histidine kinase, partial [Telluria sp.]|nr:sensor histidine kinase [Telluria sp.]
HLLSFNGMPEFVTASGVAKAINFWLAARLWFALALLAAAFSPPGTPDKAQHRINQLALLSLVYAAAVGWILLYRPDWFFATYQQDVGLTSFKIGAEWGLIALLGAAAVAWYRRVGRGDQYAPGLFAVAAGTILSEFCFTLYVGATDVFNLLGHVMKFAVYLMLYRTAFVASVRAPFERLKIEVGERTRAEEEVRVSRQQLQRLAASQADELEQQRRHIARELHDELGQALTALRLQLHWVKSQLPDAPAPVKVKFDGMLETIGTTVDAVRRISEELRPGVLDDLGLAAAVEQHVERFIEQTGIDCELELSRDEFDLDDAVAITLFRVLQEALTNVMRHAEAHHVKVILRDLPGQAQLVVRDDGRGLKQEDIGRHRFGLLGMRERVQLLGGQFSVSGLPGGGTQVEAIVPSSTPHGTKVVT